LGVAHKFGNDAFELFQRAIASHTYRLNRDSDRREGQTQQRIPKVRCHGFGLGWNHSGRSRRKLYDLCALGAAPAAMRSLVIVIIW